MKPFINSKDIKEYLGCNITKARQILREVQRTYDFYRVDDRKIPSEIFLKHIKGGNKKNATDSTVAG